MRDRRLDIKEVKEIELSILKYIKKKCEEKNLRYFLAGGTLLGAIRHQGFIPWDDDIDILMPRNDFARLLSILENGERYKSLSIYNDKDYFYSYAKIVDLRTKVYELNVDYKIPNLGVWVDVFPIDGLPDTDEEVNKHVNKLLTYRRLLYNSLSKQCPRASSKIKQIGRYIFWRSSRVFGWKFWINKIEKLATRYSYDKSRIAGCIVSGYNEREIFDKEVFNYGFQKTFESDEFSVPGDYDKFLKGLYGDYMKLPPIEKRKPAHNFDAFIIEQE